MSHQRHRSVGGIRIEGDGGHDLHIRHFLYANLFHVCVEGSIVDVAVNIEIHAFVLRNTGCCDREKKINQESSGDDCKQVGPPVVGKMVFQGLGVDRGFHGYLL